MDHPVAAAAVVGRISVAARHHRHHRAMGLHCRHPDRRRDRLRDLRAERVANRFHQIQLRRLGISQLAGSLARRPGGAGNPWRQNPGPEPAKLPVLRFGQPALPARQDAAAAQPGVPVSIFDSSSSPLSISRGTVCPDRRAADDRGISWYWCISAAAEKVLRSSEFTRRKWGRAELDRGSNGASTRSSPGIRSAQKEASLRDWFIQIFGPNTTPTN